jgi:hypothetical protein
VKISGAVLLALLSVVAAVVAAWIAKRASDRATTAQLTVAHLQRLEQRVADRKISVYDLRKSIQDAENVNEQEMTDKLNEFGAWVAIVGSDEAVRSFGNYMQGSFGNAPGLVAMRLYADFLLAARRDLGDPTSKLTAMDVWALKVNDLYSAEGALIRDTLMLPLERACALNGWAPPWLSAAPEVHS